MLWSAPARTGLPGIVCAVAVTAVVSTASAVAVEQYALTVTKNWPTFGEVTVEPNQALYDSGTVVTLTADPSPKHSWGAWVGDVPDANATDNPLELVMDADKEVQAVFTAKNPIDPNHIRWRIIGGPWHFCGASMLLPLLMTGAILCGLASWRARVRR